MHLVPAKAHHFDQEDLGDTTLLSLGKWPHQWAMLDVDETGRFSWQRFIPPADSNYVLRMERWQEAALHQRDALKVAGAQ